MVEDWVILSVVGIKNTLMEKDTCDKYNIHIVNKSVNATPELFVIFFTK